MGGTCKTCGELEPVDWDRKCRPRRQSCDGSNTSDEIDRELVP